MIDALASDDLQLLNKNLQVDNVELEKTIERKNRQYGFLLNDEKIFFENSVKRELFENVNIKEIPLMPRHILGLCNVRGNLVPVYDLEAKYDLQSKPKYIDTYKVLVVADGTDMVGFAVDKMLVAVDYYDDDLIETEITAHKKISFFIEKSFLIHGQAWHQINHRNLFDSLLNLD
jgi:chemotaxis signal transduction protein